MTRNDNAINFTNAINLIAGIWLIVAPFILNYAAFGVSGTNDVILGIIIGVLAITQMVNHRMNWPSWINAILGLWLIIAPFALSYASIGRSLWNDVILGVIIGVLAITSAVNTEMPMELHR